MSSHTGEKAHQCEICLVKFDFKSALTMHLKRKHNICKSEFKCNLCEKTFYSSAESNKHIKSHSSTGSNFTVCGQTSGKKKDIVTHMLTHVTTDQTPDHAQSHNEMQRLPYLLELKNVFQTCGLFQCFQCKLLFPALSVLEKHTLNEHGIDTSEIHANLVLNVETFSERNDSAAVAADINEELESNNANPVVTASGSKESVAIAIDVNQSSEFQINNTNLAVTSSETVKPSENFYRSSALLFQNTNPIIFTLTPSNGTVEYQTQSLINIPILLTMQPTDHVVTNGENVSMSPPLNEWKPSAEDLHSDAEMAEDTERTCPICKKTISSRSNLRVHMMIHTREQPHTCPYPGCGKKFTQRSPLQRHMAIHSGEKPWRCDTCGKSFTRQDDLVTHIRVHTGEKPYKCQECGKNFSQRGSLLTHQKMHAKHRDLAEKNKIAPGMVSCYASYPLARNYKRT
ncbi:hypothetical protein DPMN_043433 [Dreissena polymorpha]|uniref:C2H2-type domain-containing protein n=2 Tax=Dreissena polymorpha TaxID=45954 RepID=A0A9D4D0H6_DREPO|nr:hypothetical protein DPMN_043433 [Dreissena polymorpha]